MSQNMLNDFNQANLQSLVTQAKKAHRDYLYFLDGGDYMAADGALCLRNEALDEARRLKATALGK